MRTIINRELFYVILNQALLSAGSALIVILLARFTDQVRFGEIRYIIAMLAIFAFWSLPGLSMIINHQASLMTRDDMKHLISVQFRWGLGALGASMAVAYVHAFMGNHEIARAFVIGGILAPVANLYLVPGLALAGTRRFILKTGVDFLIIGTTLLGVYYGATSFHSVSSVIGSYLGAQACVTILALMLISRMLPRKRSVKTAGMREGQVAEGRQLTLLQIPFSLVPAIEKALIFLILGPVALGIFVIAVLPIEHFKTAFRNLMQFYMLPHLTKKSVHELLHWFATGALLLTLGVAALVVFIFFGMPILFQNFDAARYFSLLLVLAALPLPIHVITINWIARRKIGTLRIYAGLAIITNVLFIGVSAFLFGLLGAVIAKIVYEVFLAGGLLHLDRQQKTLTGPL